MQTYGDKTIWKETYGLNSTSKYFSFFPRKNTSATKIVKRIAYGWKFKNDRFDDIEMTFVNVFSSSHFWEP